MSSAKKFNTPFAILGDKVEVPSSAQVDGSVSYEQGYPYGYELEYTDPNTKDISRSKSNQILYDITNAIREIQQGGVSEWSEEGKPYKINSLVYAPDGTVKQSLIANNNNDTTHSSWSNLINASILPTLDTQNVKLTGNQTIAGVKTFNSTIVGSINGNSKTVTNGVYTTGNQTIAGVKTFNSTIVGSINGNSETVTNGVYTTGNQTINGVKTFSASPIVPTPTTGTQAVNKNYVDNISALPIGAILNAYTIFDNCIVAFGGEFNRADYPKLWAYLQANPSLVKTQTQWQTEATANGGVCGFFSDGNGTTTFRVPNLDKAFLRPDSRGVASYQNDAFQGHRHTFQGSSISMFGAGERNAYKSDGSSNSVTSPITDGTNGTPRTANETRPKNIAVLPLIVAK